MMGLMPTKPRSDASARCSADQACHWGSLVNTSSRTLVSTSVARPLTTGQCHQFIGTPLAPGLTDETLDELLPPGFGAHFRTKQYTLLGQLRVQFGVLVPTQLFA